MATETAQPLPLPEQHPEMGPMDLMLAVASGATGGTHPDAVVGAAQTAKTPDEAATNAQAIASYSTYSGVAKYLKNQSLAQQSQTWGQFSSQEQDGVKAAGYTPPGQQGGLLGDIGRGFNDFTKAVGGAVGTVSNVLGAPLRTEQHLERSLEAGVGNQGPGLWMLSPKDWSQYWDETRNGTAYIDPGFQQHALAQYGQDTYSLAYKLATGQTPQQILAGVPAAQQQQVGVALNSQKVQEAAAYLNAGHLSFGRQIAGQVMGGYDLHANSTFQFISGTIDGLLSWFGDPFVIGAKVGEARLAARYMVQTPEDVDRLFERSYSVRNAGRDLAAHVGAIVHEGAGLNALVDRYPRLAQSGAIQQLIAARADTEDKVQQFFASATGRAALLSGRPAHAGEAAMLPHLGYTGMLRLAGKGILTKAMDFSKDDELAVHPADVAASPGTLPTTAIKLGRGKYVTRLLRLVPTERVFHANGKDALVVLRDILSQLHSPEDADRYLTAFATNPDLGARREIYRSVVMDMGRQAGLEADPIRWKAFQEEIDKPRKFAPGDLDEHINLQGQKDHVAVLDNQQNDTWWIPSFRDLYLSANKGRMLNSFFRASNGDILDRLMSYWRPLTLARLGFATRVGGEEGLGFLLREGPLNYMRAIRAETAYTAGRIRLAASGAKVFDADRLQKALDQGLSTESIWASATRDAVNLADHGRLYNMLARGLTEREAGAATSIADLWSRSFANAVTRTMEAAGTAFTRPEYKTIIDEFVKRGALDKDSYFWDHLTAMHGYNGSQDAPKSVVEVMDRGTGKTLNAEINPGRGWRGYNATKGSKLDENLYRLFYQRSLHQLATSDWGRVVLRFDKPKADAIKDLTQVMLEHPRWRESEWSWAVDGKKVGDEPGQISERTAAGKHATRVYDMAYRMTHSPGGGMLKVAAVDGGEERLSDYLLRTGKAPPWWASHELEDSEPAQLADLAISDLPEDVAGPDMVQAIPQNGIRRMTNWMFRKYIGPQINFISRQPMYIHNAVESWKAYSGLATHLDDLGMPAERVDEFLFERVQQRAFDATIPYVHNPELRSQLSTVTRNLAPFWFAQEQFYKRWARTFVFSPWAFRQLQLISNGLSHMGFIHTDPENGQEYFVYPGSAAAVDVISHVLQAFGIKDEVPVEADLTGYVSMLNPGIQRGFLPNFGPVVSIPLDGVKTLDPHMTSAIDAVEGSASANSGFLASVMPTTVMRVMDAAAPGVFDASQYASAQMSAIQYLEATGNGLGYPALRQVGTGQPPNSGHFVPGDYFNDNGSFLVMQPGGHWADNSPSAQQAYLSRVNNWARVFFAFRALYGFAGPASPENYFNPQGMSAQLQSLMNEMPYQSAVATFMSMHPDATAMTVFQTQNELGGFLPATTTALQFIEANPSMFHGDNASGAIYFLPQADTKGTFSAPAYQEELAQHFRLQKTPQNYWTEIAYQSAANIYYNVMGYKDQLIASHREPTQKIDQMWTQFSAQFMLANPLFRQMYSDTGAITREAIMTQVGNLLADPRTPQSPQTAAVQELYNQYVAWQSVAGNYGQPHAPSTSQAYRYNVQFAQWVSQFEQQHPGVQPLVQRVIAPMLDSTLTDMAAQGEQITL